MLPGAGLFPRRVMLIAPLLAAAERPVPLIDIDATVFIQFAIFVVMLVALYFLVFQPYWRVVERRASRIDGARTDALAMQERAGKIIVDYEAKLTRAKQRGAEERTRLRGEGHAREHDVLSRAREIGQQAIQEARKTAE